MIEAKYRRSLNLLCLNVFNGEVTGFVVISEVVKGIVIDKKLQFVADIVVDTEHGLLSAHLHGEVFDCSTHNWVLFLLEFYRGFNFHSKSSS